MDSADHPVSRADSWCYKPHMHVPLVDIIVHVYGQVIPIHSATESPVCVSCEDTLASWKRVVVWESSFCLILYFKQLAC
jgi:hypothetical protein